MPLQLLFAHDYATQAHRSSPPPQIAALQAVAGLAWTATAFLVLWQLVGERVMHCRVDGRVAAHVNAMLVRQVIFTPLLLCTLAFLSLFFPGLSYGMGLVVNIAAVLAIKATSPHILEALGDAPTAKLVVGALPRRRWWCGSCCGGSADPLPCLAIFFGQGREPRRITIRQLRIADCMVSQWVFISLTVAITTYVFNLKPKIVLQDESGWCSTSPEMPRALKVPLDITNVLSCLMGMAGFNVISGAVSAAFDVSQPALAAKVRRSNTLEQLYVALPLVQLLASALPLASRSPTADVWHAGNVSTTVLNVSATSIRTVVESTSTKIVCPLYDKEVMTLMLYAAVLTVIMALLAWSHWKYYPTSEWGEVQRVRRPAGGEGAGAEEPGEAAENAGAETHGTAANRVAVVQV